MVSRDVSGSSSFAERYGPLAVVTGAAVGMGAAFARDLANRGLDLLLVDRDERALEACAVELETAGANAATLVVDLAARHAADAVIDAAGDDIGLLISNAAIGYVPQENILHDQLTVRQAIGFAADLRFAPDVDEATRDQRIAEVITLRDYTVAPYLVLATKAGLVKKTKLTDFDSSRAGGIVAINLRDDDDIPWFEVNT